MHEATQNRGSPGVASPVTQLVGALFGLSEGSAMVQIASAGEARESKGGAISGRIAVRARNRLDNRHRNFGFTARYKSGSSPPAPQGQAVYVF